MSSPTISNTGLQLWLHPGACSLAPHIVLNEVGAKYDVTVLSGPADFNEEFRRINPKLKIPVLALENKEIITEIPAILTTISYMAPEKNLLGKTPLETIRAYEWLNWLSGTVHNRGFGTLIRPERFTNDESAVESIRAKGLEMTKENFAAIEEKLEGVHAVGNDFTVIDAYLLVFYRWGAGRSLDMRAQYPKYTALVEAVAKRPAVRATVQAEKIRLLNFPDEELL